MFFGKFIAGIIFIVLLVVLFKEWFFIVIIILGILYVLWRLLNSYWDRKEGRR